MKKFENLSAIQSNLTWLLNFPLEGQTAVNQCACSSVDKNCQVALETKRVGFQNSCCWRACLQCAVCMLCAADCSGVSCLLSAHYWSVCINPIQAQHYKVTHNFFNPLVEAYALLWSAPPCWSKKVLQLVPHHAFCYGVWMLDFYFIHYFLKYILIYYVLFANN